MKNKKRFYIIIASICIAAIICVGVFFVLNKPNKSDLQTDAPGYENDADDTSKGFSETEGQNGEYSVPMPLDHTSDDPNKNVFSIERVEDDGDTVTLRLSLGGDVSICRYSISVIFDSSVLRLKSYDEELSMYSPIVYPGKDGDGNIVKIPENGIINLEWANAENVKKAGDIIEMTFEKCSVDVETAIVNMNVKAVNTIVDGVVVETDYNSKGATFDLGV